MALRRGAVLLTALLLHAAPPAQSGGGRAEHARAPAELVVLLRDPGGEAVAGATGAVLHEPASRLPALAALPEHLLARIGPHPEWRTATSDERGVLRFAGEPGRRAGRGLVTTTGGLGALLPQLLPGRAVRVELRPMGAVATASGTEAFALWPRAHTEHGFVPLPAQHGTALRLPAGVYDAWIQGDEGWSWQRLDVRAAQTTTFGFGARAQRVRAAAWLTPSGWPAPTIAAPGDVVLLRGDALDAAWTAIDLAHGLGTTTGALPHERRVEPITWPAPPASTGTRTLRLAAAHPAGSTLLVSLLRTAAGGWQLHGVAAPDDAGRCTLPEPPDGDAWLLLLAPGHAPVGTPWPLLRDDAPLAAPAGVPLVVRAVDETGLPLADVRIDYAPANDAPALVAAHTDARGEARCGRVRAPGHVLVSDERYRNDRAPIDLVPSDGLTVVVRPGAAVAGRVQRAGGETAAGVVVTLRDPTGRLRPAERAATTGDDGTFRFAGLGEERHLVLFASAFVDGRTWSGRVTSVAAGETDVTVVLRNEDPPPPGAGR
jgi:hypothetical protein